MANEKKIEHPKIPREKCRPAANTGKGHRCDRYERRVICLWRQFKSPPKTMKTILCTIISAGLIPLLLAGLIVECLLGQRVDLFKEDKR